MKAKVKIMILSFTLLFLIFSGISVFAQETGNSWVPHLFTMFGTQNFTTSQTISGGNFFYYEFQYYPSSFLGLSVQYSANLVPQFFTENLLYLSCFLSFELEQYFRSYMKFSYVMNFKSDQTYNYLAFKYCIINLFSPTSMLSISMEILGFGFMYNFESKTWNFTYQLFSMGIGF